MNEKPETASLLATLETVVLSAPLVEIPALTGSLERLKVLAFTRLIQKPEAEEGNLLNPQQVAARLNVPDSYIYELARRGELKVLKVGKYSRFTEAAVKEFQAQHGH